MAFLTDQQTIDDLQLFGKQGRNSIYNLFNSSKTHGGALLLENMFRYPLSDHNKIQARINSICFLAGSGKVFPCTIDHFDPIESYMKVSDARTRLAAQEENVITKLGNMVALDANTALICHGIDALIRISRELSDYIDSFVTDPSIALDDNVAHIKKMLSARPFSDLLILPVNEKLSREKYAALDDLLRFKNRERIFEVLHFIYMLDVYLTIGRVARERGFTFPKVLPDQQVLKVDDLYHPLIEKAIPNSLSMTDNKNVVFLTGANMAGKSTFMKSLSLAVYLAHMGFPVPAKAMTFGVLDGIYTTINLPDNLNLGASHFYVEVLRVKKIAMELNKGRKLFVLFDEMFRGTNVKDACEATISITASFARKHTSFFVISTHIIEAGERLSDISKSIRFIYLPTKMNGNHPTYTYTLTEGLSADRHGMIIINNEGILDILKTGRGRIANR